MNSCKISITIPAFKTHYLSEAIESIVCQTYSNWELIIVDDSSPEDIASIVSKYNDSRIHYYRNNTNCGAENVVDNWNICLSKCAGDYVICMGDDDRLLSTCLEEYIKLIERHPNLNIYHAKTQMIDEDSVVCMLQESRPELESAYSLIYGLWKYKRNQFIGDFMYRADWLRRNDGYVKFPYAYSSDWVTSVMACTDKPIANGQVDMFQYRISRYTISVGGNKTAKVYACFKVWEWYKEYLKKKPNNISDVVYWELLSQYLDIHFKESLCKLIESDFLSSSFLGLTKFFYWIRNHQNVRLDRKQIIKFFIFSIFVRFFHIPFSER